MADTNSASAGMVIPFPGVPLPTEKQRGRPKKPTEKNRAPETFEFYARAISSTVDPKIRAQAKEQARIVAQADPARLSRSALIVLNLYLDQGTSLWRVGYCNISINQLAKRGNISPRTAARSNLELEDAGLILRPKKPDGEPNRTMTADGGFAVTRVTLPVLARVLVRAPNEIGEGVLSEKSVGTDRKLENDIGGYDFSDSTPTDETGAHTSCSEVVDRKIDSPHARELVCTIQNEVSTDLLLLAGADPWSQTVKTAHDAWHQWATSSRKLPSLDEVNRHLEHLVGGPSPNTVGREASRRALVSAVGAAEALIRDGSVKAPTSKAFVAFLDTTYRQKFRDAATDLAGLEKDLADIRDGKTTSQTRALTGSKPPRPNGPHITQDGRTIFNPDHVIRGEMGNKVFGSHINPFLERHQFVTVADIEAADHGREKISGKMVAVITRNAFAVAAKREFGDPELQYGGPVATFPNGATLSTEWACVSQATIDRLRVKYPDADRPTRYHGERTLCSYTLKNGVEEYCREHYERYGTGLQAEVERVVEEHFAKLQSDYEGEKKKFRLQEARDNQWKQLGRTWSSTNDTVYITPTDGRMWNAWLSELKFDSYLQEKAVEQGYMVVPDYLPIGRSSVHRPLVNVPPKGWENTVEIDQ